VVLAIVALKRLKAHRFQVNVGWRLGVVLLLVAPRRLKITGGN
jgi:hypothetical protein